MYSEDTCSIRDMYGREKRESRKGGEGAVIVQFDATRGGLWPRRPGLATGQVDPANPPEAFSSARLVDNHDGWMTSVNNHNELIRSECRREWSEEKLMVLLFWQISFASHSPFTIYAWVYVVIADSARQRRLLHSFPLSVVCLYKGIYTLWIIRGPIKPYI